jgi:hypothetical protein
MRDDFIRDSSGVTAKRPRGRDKLFHDSVSDEAVVSSRYDTQ